MSTDLTTYIIHCLPDVLVVQSNCYRPIPPILQLQDECFDFSSYFLLFPFLGSLKVYQLYAVCFYRGIGSEGHYYAETLSQSNNIWLRFNAVDICYVTTWGIKNDIPTLMFYRRSTLPWDIPSGESPHSLTPPSFTQSTPLPNNTPLSQTSPLINTMTLPNPTSPSESPTFSNTIPLPNRTPASVTTQLPDTIPPPNSLATPLPAFHSSGLTKPSTNHATSSNTLSSPFHDRVFRTAAITSAQKAFHSVLYVCHICGYTCSTSRTLTKHIRHQHSSYKCSLCAFHADDSASLSIHIQQSHAAPLKCSVCRHVSTTRKAAKQHYLRQHITKGRFRCTVDGCNSSFSTRYNYNRHMKRVHKQSNTRSTNDNHSTSSPNTSQTTNSGFLSSTQSSESDIHAIHNQLHSSEPFPLPPSLCLRDPSVPGPSFLAKLTFKDKNS